MRIAIEGCLHGELDIVYNTIKYIEQGIKPKLICSFVVAIFKRCGMKPI